MRNESDIMTMLRRADTMLHGSKSVQPSGGDSIVAYEYETNKKDDLLLKPTTPAPSPTAPDGTAQLNFAFTTSGMATADVAFEIDVFVNGTRIDKLPTNQPYAAYLTFLNPQEEPSIDVAKNISGGTVIAMCDVGYTITAKVRAIALCKGSLETWVT